MWQKLEIIYIYIYIYGFGFKRSKGTTQKYRRRWHSNININLTEMRWDDVHWIHQYRDRQKPGGGGGVHKMLEITLLVEKLILIVRRVFLLFGYPDWGFSVLFPHLQGKCQGITRQHGARSALFQNFCVVLYIVCFVSFCVFFVCKRVLYYCHRVTTQLQSTLYTSISYNLVSQGLRPREFVKFIIFIVYT